MRPSSKILMVGMAGLCLAGMLCVTVGGSEAVMAYAVVSLAVFVLTTLGAVAQCCGAEATDLRDLYREERKMYKEKVMDLEAKLDAMETELIKAEKLILRGENQQSAGKTAESRIAIASCS